MQYIAKHKKAAVERNSGRRWPSGVKGRGDRGRHSARVERFAILYNKLRTKSRDTIRLGGKNLKTARDTFVIAEEPNKCPNIKSLELSEKWLDIVRSNRVVHWGEKKHHRINI